MTSRQIQIVRPKNALKIIIITGHPRWRLHIVGRFDDISPDWKCRSGRYLVASLGRFSFRFIHVLFVQLDTDLYTRCNIFNNLCEQKCKESSFKSVHSQLFLLFQR